MVRAINLETKRLVLKTFSEKFLTSEYVSWLNDSEVVKYSEQRHKVHTVESCRNYFNSFQYNSNLFLAVLEKNSQRHIGNLTCILDLNNRIADIAILIGDKNYWNKGLATEIYIKISEFLFSEFEMRKLTAGTVSINKGMLSVMDKSGFQIEAVRKNHYLFDNSPIDLILAAKFNVES